MQTTRATAVVVALSLFVLGCGFAVAQEDARPPMPDPGDGYRTLNLGNSLVGQLHVTLEHDGKRIRGGLLPFLAGEFGYAGHEGKIVGAAGVPLEWLWSKPAKRREFQQALENTEWELLTAMPFGFQNRRSVIDEAAGAAGYYYQMLAKYPDVPLLVYQTWGSGRSPGGAHHDLEAALAEGGGDAQLFVKGLGLAVDYMNSVAHILRQEFPDRPVYIVPVPQVMIEFQKRLEASETGTYAGIDHIARLLDSGGRSVHVSRKGLWLNAMTHLAAYYRKNPAEADIPHDYANMFAFDLDSGFQKPGLSEEGAKELAQLAWDVVSTCPATPVTREQFEFDDMEKPTGPADVQVEPLGPMHARVTWSASTDNAAIKSYGVYLNHDLVRTVAPDGELQMLVTGMNPGQENLVTVRAFDTTYNLAHTHVTITAQDIDGEPLLGWNLAQYTDRRQIRRGEKPDETLPADTWADGVRGQAVVKRGPGLENKTGVFGSCVDISGIENQSLADAIADEDYLTVTVAPEPGKSLALSALVFPIRIREHASMAVLTSADGFQADAAVVRAEKFPDGFQDGLALDLSGSAVLRDVSEPVELRIYFYDAGGQALLGRPNAGTPADVMDMILYGKVQ